MSKFGFHISSGNRQGFGDLLKNCYDAKSPVKGVHCLDQDVKPDIIKYSPSTKIIYRHQIDCEDNPSNMYSGTESEIRNRITDWMLSMRENWLLNPADYYAPFNEPNPATLDEFVKLNIIMDQSISLANSWGIKLALPAFTTGTPSDDGGSTRYEKLNKIVPSLIKMKSGGHILNIHEYGFSSTLKESAPNHALRFISLYDFLVPRGADPLAAITECSPYAGYSGNDVECVADWRWYDSQVMYGKYHEHILFFCAYQLGGAENFYTLLPKISTYIASTPDNVVIPPDPIEPPTVELPYVVTAYLGPQNATLEEMYKIQSEAFATKSTVCQSADDARHLVRSGKPESKAIIYNPQSWPGGVTGISDYFSGLNIEFRYLSPINDDFRLKSPILNIPFRVTDVMDSPREYGKHEGVDLDSFDDIAKIPVPVYACADGVVEQTVSAGSDPHYPGYGNYVVVKHDHYGQIYKTWYCHLGQILVSVGTQVKTGTKIAISGNSGTPTPPIHLHLNLQKIGGGLDGYVVPDVVNPLDYINKPTEFKSGVGMGNITILTNPELSAITTSKVKAVKLLTLPDYNANTSLVNQVKNLFIVSRLFFSPNEGSKFTSQDFVNYCKNGVDAQYKAGVRYFEIHNEPNLRQEGYGWNWANGREFGNWLIGVLNILKPLYPEAKFGYPGLSPQPNTEQFFIESKFSADQCAWVGCHSYWNSEGNIGWGMESIDGGMYWKKYLNWTIKPLYLTEFSNNNPNVSYTDKGKQYKKYFTLVDGLEAAFCFALSWPGQDINKEAWVIGNTITQIPYEVGL